MHYQFKFQPYQRQFQRPLKTGYGTWEIREGIIVSLTDTTGKVGRGEIAPIPWFGSETLLQALAWCRQFPVEVTSEAIFSIPDNLPACQFGFETAWESLKSGLPLPSQNRYSGLLPAGEVALQTWRSLWDRGYSTFKWKIGVNSIADELKIFSQLIQSLPTDAKLRLDANASLNWDKANQWLQACEGTCVEFLEQPLEIAEFDAMLNLSQQYSTPLALDESVATLTQLQACYQQGWRNIFVIKPCIAGSPQRLREFCQQFEITAVFSSGFETTIGRNAALKLAAELSHPDFALGFGIDHWFAEGQDSLCKKY